MNVSAHEAEDARVRAALKIWREVHDTASMDDDPDDLDHAAMSFAIAAAMETAARAHAWIVGDDTGLSSKHLWAVMMGVRPGRPSYPADPADLGRCLRLLAAIPEWRLRIREMADECPVWDGLTARWDELEALFLEEAGSLNPPFGLCASRTYCRMKEIREQAHRQVRPR